MPSAYERLPLGALRVFEAVATHLNFSAAADALNVTPAAVSQQIKTLESYIQVPLFGAADGAWKSPTKGSNYCPRSEPASIDWNPRYTTSNSMVAAGPCKSRC